MRISRLFILAVVAALCGCAKTTNIKPEQVVINSSEGQIAPVRVFINRRVPVARFYVSRLEAIESALKESGAFFDIGSHVDSPFILDIELSRGTNDTAGDTAGQILSAATLFLVPSKVHNFNELKVAVYAYGNIIKNYEFKQEYTQVLGLHNYNEVATNQDNEFLSIKNLVNKFVNALDADKLLPKVKLRSAPEPATETPSTIEL
ncbi:MAG: hypothetical protein M9960_03590 [Xanthomonadaceae bacterium]|jgi:hypothetical protein|nr:hypothetical protein [Xanthomonadaceae bacterium]